MSEEVTEQERLRQRLEAVIDDPKATATERMVAAFAVYHMEWNFALPHNVKAARETVKWLTTRSP